jgi:hypothetical protein
MLLIDSQAERSRKVFAEQAEVRAREAEAAHTRQLEVLREDARRREKELDVERERMTLEASERSARLDRELAAERERQREHMSLMLQVVREKGAAAADQTPLSALMAGIKLATELGGGGNADPLAALAANLPEVIAEARKLAAVEANPAKPAEGEADDQGVKLEGEVGAQAKLLVEHLQAQGKDPAVELSRVFAVLRRPRLPPPKPATTAAAPAAPRAQRAAARRPTPRPAKSRARGKPATG